MKIGPVGAEPFHADRRTYAQDETDCRFSQKISERAQKTGSLMKKLISNLLCKDKVTKLLKLNLRPRSCGV